MYPLKSVNSGLPDQVACLPVICTGLKVGCLIKGLACRLLAPALCSGLLDQGGLLAGYLIKGLSSAKKHGVRYCSIQGLDQQAQGFGVCSRWYDRLSKSQ